MKRSRTFARQADREWASKVSRAVQRVPTRRTLSTLPLDEVSPVIRIAHRLRESTNISERLIVDHELVLITKGSLTMTIHGKDLELKVGDLIFLPPFIPHAFRSERPLEHLAVHFDFAPRSSGGTNLERRRPYGVRLAEGLELPFRSRVVAGGSIERSLRALVAHFSRGDSLGRMRARAALLDVIAELIQMRDQGDSPLPKASKANTVARARLERTLTLVRERFAAHLSPADLRRAAGLRESQLHALFKEHTGYAPMDYVRRYRVERARALLANAELSVKQVAAMTGFDDPYHFSRVFRQIDGVAPSEYRAAVLGRDAKS